MVLTGVESRVESRVETLQSANSSPPFLLLPSNYLCICIYKILVCLAVDWHSCSTTLSWGKINFHSIFRFSLCERVFAVCSCVISDELTFVICSSFSSSLCLCFSFTLQIACDTFRLTYSLSLSLSVVFPIPRA